MSDDYAGLGAPTFGPPYCGHHRTLLEPREVAGPHSHLDLVCRDCFPELFRAAPVPVVDVEARPPCRNAGRWNDCHSRGWYWYNEDTPMAGQIPAHWSSCDAGCKGEKPTARPW